MHGSLSGSGRRSIATLFGEGSCAGLTDGELLERGLSRRGEAAEAAFAALVERHGPMVLRVCRDVLRDPHDAQDAFQATFLVLVQRGGTIRNRQSLAGWLHGVARRVAGCSRASALRRRRHEQAAGRRDFDADCDHVGDPDLPRIVQDELGRLPERYRMAVVLCDLEGLGLVEAARLLGCPVGTLKSRLARGRVRLRDRLSRRGLAPAVALPGQGAPIAVPPPLAESTARLAWRLAAGGPVPLPISSLVAGVSRTMMLSSWKPVAVLLAVMAVPAGAGLMAQASRPRPAPVARADRAKPPTRVRQPLPEYVVEPPDLIVVEVLEALPGRPITGERLVRPDGTISLDFYGKVYVDRLTTSEIKEKIVRHLRTYLADEMLGLIDVDEETGKPIAVAPADTDRVFVDVTAYNSKHYYVQGAVQAPGRLPITGRDTVLDAINLAGGLASTASQADMRLIRPASPGASGAQVLPISYKAIVEEGDTATNYQLLPGDRILVPRDLEADVAPPDPPPSQPTDVQALERRIAELERKLDRVLEALGQSEPGPR